LRGRTFGRESRTAIPILQSIFNVRRQKDHHTGSCRLAYGVFQALTNKIFCPKNHSLSITYVPSSGFFLAISCLIGVSDVPLRPRFGKRHRGTTFAIVHNCLRGAFSFMFLKN